MKTGNPLTSHQNGQGILLFIGKNDNYTHDLPVRYAQQDGVVDGYATLAYGSFAYAHLLLNGIVISAGGGMVGGKVDGFRGCFTV